MSDEAHLPTEQSGPQAAARVPAPHGDAGRPQVAQRSARPRPQEAQRLATIKKRADFLAANGGRRASTPGFILLVRDRTLGLALGWLSWGSVAVGVFAGFLLGGLAGLGGMLVFGLSRKSLLPFGPWLVTGALLSVLVGGDVADWYTRTLIGT